MKLTTIQVGTFEVNCSILGENGKAVVVDPGSEATRIRAELKKQNLELAAALLTHAHFDHIGAIPELRRAFPSLPIFVSASDAKIIDNPFNQNQTDYPPVGAVNGLRDTNDLNAFLASIGWTTTVKAIDTPGHTPGGVCYLFSDRTLLSGDTLFCGSVGRTDFPGGDMATLRASLEKLKSLPGDTVVVPGHGPETTIARELATNPFLLETS